MSERSSPTGRFLFAILAWISCIVACTTNPFTPSHSKPPAAKVHRTDTELSALVDRFTAYTLRVPTAERSPAIQAEDDREAQEMQAAFATLEPEQAMELQRRVFLRMATPSLLKLVDGALLADDFATKEIDLRRWQILRQDPGIHVVVDGGELRVSGAAAGGMKLGPGFCGLVSKTFADTAVELVTRMRVVTAPPTAKGDFLAFVHLCSSQPDFFAHVEAGKRDVDEAPRYAAARRAADNEGDAIAIASPWKLGEWVTVKIRHLPASGVAGATDVSLTPSGGTPLPALTRVPMSFTSTKIELKVLDTITDSPIDARFDDCRIYRAPSSAPLVVQVLEGGHEGKGVAGLAVTVRVIGSQAAPIEGRTDVAGRCAIVLPDDVDYPARIRVTAKRGETMVLDAFTAQVQGVRGVYPGDVWLVRI